MTLKLRDSFCALVLTHGRPDNLVTLRSLKNGGYTGPVFLVVDDEDPTLPQYLEKYGGQVKVFSKQAAAEAMGDEGHNDPDRRCIVYARNQAWDIAAAEGYEWFIQLDDDYHSFGYKFDGDLVQRERRMRCLDHSLEWLVRFMEQAPHVATISMSQGGDLMAAKDSPVMAKRKAMNSFVCHQDRRFVFPPLVNEDVSAYTELQRRGLVFMQTNQLILHQHATQGTEGGMTGLYEDTGTYVKSFSSVMRCPSGVKVATLAGKSGKSVERIHHRVKFDAVAPKIIPESVRKP